MAAGPALHTLPISGRPPNSWPQTVHGILFGILFDFALFMINGFQLVFLLPLLLLPFDWSRDLYEVGVRYTKGCFATLLSESDGFLCCQAAQSPSQFS
jgi:hypothetical protein